MSLQDLLNSSTKKKLQPVVRQEVKKTSVQSNKGLYIPPRDKVLAIDKSTDLQVTKRQKLSAKGFEGSLAIKLILRNFLHKRPELQFVEFHTANVFGKKSCYIFYDKNRKIKVAYNKQEIQRYIK